MKPCRVLQTKVVDEYKSKWSMLTCYKCVNGNMDNTGETLLMSYK